MTSYEESIFHNAIGIYGVDSQIRKAEEELNELQKELFKWQEGYENRSHIVEEMADVGIMLDQLKMLFAVSDKELNAERLKKVTRLANRLLLKLEEVV